MKSEVISEIVDVILDAKIASPGVAEDIFTAAYFADQWIGHDKEPVFPFLGLR